MAPARVRKRESSPRADNALHLVAARLRPGLARSRADARSEHDLSDLALDHAGARGRHRLARRRGARLRVLHAVRRVRHHARCCSPCPTPTTRCALPARPICSGWPGRRCKPGRPLAVPGEEARDRQPARNCSGWVSSPTCSIQGRDAVSRAAAAVHRSCNRQRARRQSVVLGAIQIVISVSVNAMIALAAGSIALFLARRPAWMLLQRCLMGTVLAGLAVRMAFEEQAKALTDWAMMPRRRGMPVRRGSRNSTGVLDYWIIRFRGYVTACADPASRPCPLHGGARHQLLVPALDVGESRQIDLVARVAPASRCDREIPPPTRDPQRCGRCAATVEHVVEPPRLLHVAISP